MSQLNQDFHPGAPPTTVAPYHFAIGSVESFERKLEDAQKVTTIVVNSPVYFYPGTVTT